jgi:hypothetical protein
MSGSSQMNTNGNCMNAWALSRLVTVQRAIINLVRKILIAYVPGPAVDRMLGLVHFKLGSVLTSFSLSRNNISPHPCAALMAPTNEFLRDRQIVVSRLRAVSMQILHPLRFGADGLKSIATIWIELRLSPPARDDVKSKRPLTRIFNRRIVCDDHQSSSSGTVKYCSNGFQSVDLEQSPALRALLNRYQ